MVQQLVARIPWGHVVRLLDGVKDSAERQWYTRACVKHGWSRNTLVAQIESGLFRRQGRAVTNFETTLPGLQSDLAREILKDPYNFDFLSLGAEARERDLHRGLLLHLRDFLLEMGAGFAFVGSQQRLEVGGEDFFLDLLFYHFRLRCFVVVDLKMAEFRPSDAGQLNFYLSAVDDLLRHPDDRPTIGIVLCKGRNRVVAEYALRDITKPIGVAGFRITDALPTNLRGSLPTVDELEAELGEVSGGATAPE
jgi:predicted nuclease of restriction endonuclease-like (RecB) superfamily